MWLLRVSTGQQDSRFPTHLSNGQMSCIKTFAWLIQSYHLSINWCRSYIIQEIKELYMYFACVRFIWIRMFSASLESWWSIFYYNNYTILILRSTRLNSNLLANYSIPAPFHLLGFFQPQLRLVTLIENCTSTRPHVTTAFYCSQRCTGRQRKNRKE